MLAPAIASLRKDLALLTERVRRCRANRASDTAMHDAAAAISNPARRFPSLTREFLTLSRCSATLMQRELALPAGAGLWSAAS